MRCDLGENVALAVYMLKVKHGSLFNIAGEYSRATLDVI